MNDLISVDELIQAVLGDSELHCVTGNWSEMRQLLDELMPQPALSET